MPAVVQAAPTTVALALCVGDKASGATIDTTTAGVHTFTVTATSVSGGKMACHRR